MSRVVLILILLICISSGILYIYTKKQKSSLEIFSNKCPQNCKPATQVTGNCSQHSKINNKIIFSCPQECRARNINNQLNSCTYDEDCSPCKGALMYSDGTLYKKNGNKKVDGKKKKKTGNKPAKISGTKPIKPSFITHTKDETYNPTPPFAPKPTEPLPLPTTILTTTGKGNNGSPLCPGSTIIIFE